MGAALDKIVIIGHRGTGKTSLLKRWKTYSPNLKFADLDQEIEKAANLSVTEIFSQKGEAAFRELEKDVWQKLQNYDVVSVGGGFDLNLINQSWKLLWARRDSDSYDRIFLDRPALSDYKDRFEKREILFNEKADLIYTMPEGLFNQEDAEEKKILTGNFNQIGGAVTTPRIEYPDCIIEVRDDLKFREYETSNLLFSVRSGHTYPPDTKIDWDIKKPIPEGLNPYIISTHDHALDPLLPYENTQSILKFCPIVKTWSELEIGLSWQQKNPAKHVFLPRSENGKWSWFRLWMKGKQSLNFWREGAGSAHDQPTLWEWLSHPNQVTQFAAVLGSPVKHSYSPMYHKNFFKAFYKIDIEENEWNDAIKILEKMGLIAAAVTSPLKHKAGEFVKSSALNTLWKQDGNWHGANTDIVGARHLVEDFKNESIVVWGGGGILETFKEILPAATFYSSQKAKPREGYQEIENPKVLIWGDPHNSIAQIPKSWKPEVIIDLSYHDKSAARILAQKTKAQYISGLKMFIEQAEEQQKCWSKIVR